VTPAAVAQFAPIGLEQVVALADLQIRRDRKYLLPADEADAVLEGIDAWVLEIDGSRSFRYESIYFDTNAGTATSVPPAVAPDASRSARARTSTAASAFSR